MKDIDARSCEQGTEVSRSEPSAEADPCVISPSAKSKEKKAMGVAKFMRRKPQLRRYGGDANELAAKVFEFSREGILITDSQMNILSVNQAFTLFPDHGADGMTLLEKAAAPVAAASSDAKVINSFFNPN